MTSPDPSGAENVSESADPAPGAIRASAGRRAVRTLIPVALLGALIALWFGPVWWGGDRVLAPLDIQTGLLLPWREIPVSGREAPAGAQGIAAPDAGARVHNAFPTDAITQYLIYRWIAERSFREDGYVGWTRTAFCGFPQFANTMATPFDWTVQLHRWLPFWQAYHWGLWGQLMAAGCGMLAFLRARGHPAPVALAGAVAYAGNAQFVVLFFHRWALGSFCWMPWVLLAWQGLSQRRDPSGRGGGLDGATLFLPATLALAFLGGSLQHAAFVVLACAILAVSNWWGGSRTAALHLGLALVLAAGLAAPMFIPTIHAYLENLGTGNLRGALAFPSPKQAAGTALEIVAGPFPWPFGRAGTLDVWKPLGGNLIQLAFFGFLPGVLALRSLVGSKAVPSAPRWLMWVGLVLPFTPLVGPLYHRVLLLFVLGGVWAFAERLGDPAEPGRRFWKILLLLLGLGTIAWLIASLAVEFGRDQVEALFVPRVVAAAAGSQFGPLPEVIADRARAFLDEFRIWHPSKSLPLLLAGLGILLVMNWRRIAPQWRWALPALVAAETTLLWSQYITFSPRPPGHPLAPALPGFDQVRELVGHGTVVQPEVGPVWQSGPAIATQAFPPNTLAPYGIPMLVGYESIHPPGLLPTLGWELSTERLSRFAVTHALRHATTEPIAGWTEIWRGSGLALDANPDTPARFLAQTGPARSDAPPATPTPVVLKRETMNRRWIDLPEGTRKLVARENYHPDWRLIVLPSGGTSAHPDPIRPVRRADGSMEFSVPGGARTALLEFRPARWPWAITAGSAAIALGSLLIVRPAPRARTGA
jgi:hypothetical protein